MSKLHIGTKQSGGQGADMTIVFSIAGIPKPQPRPRSSAYQKNGKLGVRVYDAGTAECWKNDVAVAARGHIPATPLTGPLEVEISLRLPRPKNHYRTGRNAGALRDSAPEWHDLQGDADNFAKSTLDCMTTIRFWSNDGQVARLIVEKRYTGDRPGATVRISTLEQTAVNDAAGSEALPLMVGGEA